jgi:hypothetical protein
MRDVGVILRSQAAIVLLGTAALGSVAAEETKLRSSHDLLWLPTITNRQNLDMGLRRLLETLDKSKVPTAEKAEEAALWAKLKAGGLLAEEGARVVGLVRLGVDVAEFATSGDLVWVVQIEHAVRGVTQEVWVSSTTGAVRAMLPLQAKPGQ